MVVRLINFILGYILLKKNDYLFILMKLDRETFHPAISPKPS